MIERAAVKARASDRLPMTVTRTELTPGGDDREFRTLVHTLLAFAVRLEAVRSGFGARIGLSGIQYSTLISIAHLGRDEPVGVKQIADHLGLSGSFATLVVGQLVTIGLVDKATDPDDRRRVRLTVTPKAQDLLAELAPAQRQVNDRLFAPLSTQDLRTISRIFGELVMSGDGALGMLQYLPDGEAEAPVRREANRR
jgi:DNA-binding MarR family transcriptional regulator